MIATVMPDMHHTLVSKDENTGRLCMPDDPQSSERLENGRGEVGQKGRFTLVAAPFPALTHDPGGPPAVAAVPALIHVPDRLPSARAFPSLGVGWIQRRAPEAREHAGWLWQRAAYSRLVATTSREGHQKALR